MANKIRDIKILAGGGLDQDSAPEFIAPNDYREAFNLRLTGTSDEEVGYGVNIEGTTAVEGASLATGINKCIGSTAFETIRKAIGFIYNSQGYHKIVEFDYDTNTTTALFTNKTDSGGEDVLPLSVDYYVTDIKLINDTYLGFVAGNLPPCLINLNRLRDGEYGTLTENDFTLIKPQPLAPVRVSYNDDAKRSSNQLQGKLFQFLTQFTYLDDDSSACSTWSKRVVPEQESTSSVGTDVTKNNNLILTVDIGSDRVKSVTVSARYGIYDFFDIKTISREEVLAITDTSVDVDNEVYEAYDPSTNTYSFSFYNDGLYINKDVLLTDLAYDYVPRKAGAMEVVNGNIIVLGDVTEGYDRPSTNVTLTQGAYDPQLTISQPTAYEKISDTWYQVEAGSGNKKYRRVYITFSGLPKTGDEITITTCNLEQTYNFTPTTTYTVLVADEDNLLSVIQKMAATMTYPTSVISLSGGRVQLYFSTRRKNETPTGDTEIMKSVTYDYANAGSGESKAIHALKSNSAYQLALSYRDKVGRYFPLRTGTDFVVKTPSYSQLEGLTPSISWKLNDTTAPEGAVDYQWLISKNNTHENSLYVSAKLHQTLTDYLVLDISPLKEFNETNSSSVIAYDYTEGDRCSLHYYLTGETKTWLNNPCVEVEVVGFEIDVTPATETDPEITRYLLKVRKSSALTVSSIESKDVVIEIYTPKKRAITDADGELSYADTVFFEIGERYTITDGVHDTTSGVITDGDIYFKTREIESAVTPSTLLQLIVEDFNFSDYYQSNYTSYGRPRSYYDTPENVRKKASIRYSDTFILGSRNNGLNRFFGERIYGEGDAESSSSYGAIAKLRQRNNVLVCFQELDLGYIPVFGSIIEDQAAQEQISISDRLLNKIRYTGSGKSGIGTAKESFAEDDSGTYYFVDPNRSVPMRAGLDGVRPIAGKMSKYFKRVIQQSYSEGKRVIGIYDAFYKEYMLVIESSGDVVKTITFNASSWDYQESYTIAPNAITVGSAAKGSVSYNTTTGIATYTAEESATGSDTFTASFTVDGQPIVKNICGTITAASIEPFALVDVTNAELSTPYESNAVVAFGGDNVKISISGGEYQVNGENWTAMDGTVSEFDDIKVRVTTSASHTAATSATLTIANQSDIYTVTTKAIDITPDAFSYTDVANANISTQYESSTVTITGINVPATVTPTGCEYSIDGGAYTSSVGSITNGQTLRLRKTSSGSYSTLSSASVQVGASIAPWQITTKVAPSVTANYSLTKDEDPHVDVVIVPLVNGNNKGNIYATSSGAIPDVVAGATVAIYISHSDTAIRNPDGATGRLVVLKDGVSIFDSGEVSAAGADVTNHSFVAEEGSTYAVNVTSTGDTTYYKPVEIIQINNSSAPNATTHPVPVEFEIRDNTDGLFVFKDGAYGSPQNNGFNYLDDANQATLIITNRHSGSLRFLIQNGTGDVTHWSDLDVAAGASLTLTTLPKESVKITYTDTPAL